MDAQNQTKMSSLCVTIPVYLTYTTYGQLLLKKLNKNGLQGSKNVNGNGLDIESLSRAGVLGSMPSRYSSDYTDGLAGIIGVENDTIEEDPEEIVENKDDDVRDSVRYNHAMMDIDDESDIIEHSDFSGDRDLGADMENNGSRRRKLSTKRRRSSVLQHRSSFNSPFNLLKDYPLPYKIEKPSKQPSSSSSSSSASATTAGLYASCQISQDGKTLTLPNILKPGDCLLFKTNNFIPIKSGIFYYETTILPNPPTSSLQTSSTVSNSSSSPANVTIGFIHTCVGEPTKMPGVEPHSFGYNAQDGTITANQSTHRGYSISYGVGDIIGCGVDFVNSVIFYTKNGVSLGVAFHDVISVDDDEGKWGGEKGLIPVVGIRGASVGGIKVNFGLGADVFLFDIEGYVGKCKNSVLKKVLSEEEEVNEKKKENNGKDIELRMQELVCEYFDHLGYVDISKTFKREVFEKEKITLSSEIDEDVLKFRQSIRRLLLDGEIDQVIDLVNDKFPKVFDLNRDLLFRLNCQKFINYIKSNAINDSISFGQQLRSEYPNRKHQEQINDISSLLAYPDPELSEFGFLLKTEEVLKILDLINSEILRSLGKEDISDLERLARHDGALLELLTKERDNESLVLRLGDFME